MTKKMYIISVSVILMLSVILPMFAFAPATAKDLNWSFDIYKIDYINAGGDADMVLPTPLPLNYPTTYPQMRLRAAHFEMPNVELSYNNLLVFLYDPAKAAAGKNPWQPYAMITDGDDAQFQRTFWSGTFVEFNAQLYGLPASFGTDNVITVDKGVLSIERQGNNLAVTLNAEQTIKKVLVPTSPSAYFTLPAFTLELSSYGEAYHKTASETMLGWRGGSGYTTR